jgi:PAS domain S-box-containing protein
MERKAVAASIPIRILVMEDDPGQAWLVQRALQRAGYVVALAPDGETGLALYEAGAYDLLIVDHQMPGKGGLEVLRTLTVGGEPPPMIMVTGHGDEAVAVEAMKLGAGDYIVKDVAGRYFTLLPVVIERVLAQRRLLVEKRQAEAALQQTLEALEARVAARTAELQQANAQLRAEIVERQQAAAALRKSEERFRLLVHIVGSVIIVLSRDYRIVEFNQEAGRVLGWTRQEVLGQDYLDLCVPVALRQDVAAALDQVLWGEPMRGVESVIRTRAGQERTMLWNFSRVLDADEDPMGLIASGQDITERKRAEQELQRADRLALVGQLASGLAHEIGTPLNVIAGNAELLRQELLAQGLPAPELETIVAQADRISRLMERLLAFARAKAQPQAPLALSTVLAPALHLLEPRFRREAITVLVDVPADLPDVLGVADQLEQVFLNVLVNAWHAMPAGGTVTIRAGTTAAGQVQVTVQDTGSGIAPEALTRAFEPFYSTKGERGTGLGLPICRQIIDSHRGTIRLDSTPGEGTTVTITLPLAEATGQE